MRRRGSGRAVISNGAHHGAADFFGASRVFISQRLHDAVLAELIAISVFGFGDSIGKEDQMITAL